LRIDAKNPDDLEPSYMVDSAGHWEGDTPVLTGLWRRQGSLLLRPSSPIREYECAE
jgi:hypothetical protein